MQTELAGYDNAGDIFQVYKVYAFVIGITYFILIFDWLSNLTNEYKMVVHPKAKSGSDTNKFLAMKPVFLASRYLTLFWCTFVVASWASASSHHNVCNWFKHYPYIYSIVFLPAHLLMILRIHSIYGRPAKLLYFLMGLALVDFIVQMATNHLATSLLLESRNPNFAICFTYPTTAVFSLVFISPTIFHHILLGLTLWKSVRQLRTSKSMGITPILHIIQRDHILYTLAICLVNFANLVLVLQPGAWPYKLINQLPALVFTQIFLSRMVFSLKATQVRSLAGVGLSDHSSSGPSDNSKSTPPVSETHIRSGSSDSATMADSRKGSMSEKAASTLASPSSRKLSRSQDKLRRPSGDSTSNPNLHQPHRRSSSTTLATDEPVPRPYRFPAYKMRGDDDTEKLPPVPTLADELPSPPSWLPTKYQHYRIPTRTFPQGRFKRQSGLAEDLEAGEQESTASDNEVAERTDRILDIRKSPTSPAFSPYPYLFEPPGTAASSIPPRTAASSLPPQTAISDVANRSSGDWDYLDPRLASLRAAVSTDNTKAAPGTADS